MNISPGKALLVALVHQHRGVIAQQQGAIINQLRETIVEHKAINSASHHRSGFVDLEGFEKFLTRS